MAEEREILRYELDLTDVEAKVARVQQLIQEIGAQKAAGRDTSAAEQQVHVQLAGLSAAAGLRDAEAMARSSGATEELVRQKAKLAAVVNMVGGQFGGAVQQVGSLVALLTTATPVVGGVALALAGVGAATAAWRHMREEIEKANAELRKFGAGQRALIEEKRGPLERIEGDLLSFGALKPGAAEGAFRLGLSLQKEGIPEDLALKIAPLAYAAGVDARTASLLAMVGTVPGVEPPKTPEEFAASAKRLGEADVTPFEERLAGLRASGLGRRAAGFAALWEKLLTEEPERWKALLEPSDDALLVEFGKRIGIVPTKAGPESPEKWRAKLEALYQQREKIEALMRESEREIPGIGVWVDTGSRLALQRIGPQIKLLEKMVEGRDVLGQLRDAAGEGPTQPERRSAEAGASGVSAESPNVYNIANQVYGTQYNTPPQQNRRFGPRMGRGVLDALAPLP